MINFLKNSIKSKIIYTTLTVTLLITLFTASLCFFSFQGLLYQSLSQSTAYSLRMIMNNFSNNMKPITSFSNWCANRDIINRYLTADESDFKNISVITWQRLREEYLNNPSSKFIDCIVIGNSGQHYLHISREVNSNAFNVIETITALPYFESLYSSKDVEWIGFVPDPFSGKDEDLIIPIITPISSPYYATKTGWCFIAISPDLIIDSLKEYPIPKDSDLYLTISDKTYHFINDTLIELSSELSPEIFQTDTTYKDGAYFQSTILDSQGDKRTLITTGCSIKGWYLSQTLSQTQFTQQENIYKKLIVLICIIVPTLGISLTFYVHRLINLPLKKIRRKINAISKGDFSYDSEIEWDNELGDIGKGINTLSKDITQLMNTRIENEKEKKQLEYQILQSQINPHFLYNTLNSIKWMATIQNATGIAEMTTALSKLMRSVSKDIKQVVTLKDELALLDNYFLIQKYRYGGTLSLDYNIENEKLKDCQILKFTLQPIVENAIFHGVESKGEVGHIQIDIEENENKLLIHITDNGMGMSPQQMESLLINANNAQPEFFKKIGINNVHQRIQFTFGSDYGLSFSSELGNYTTVTITLPCIYEKSHL